MLLCSAFNLFSYSIYTGKPRAPPKWKGAPASQSETAPKGSVGQGRESGPNRKPPNWSAPGEGGAGGRQPPNWGGSDTSGAGVTPGGQGGFPMSGGMNPMSMAAMAGGDGLGGGDSFGDMMEMQRKMMFDPR